MNIPNFIKELVKNSIDAQCSVLEIELNKFLDVRVTDDGCGFDEQVLHDIGKRQVLISSNEEFRYGKKGKSLLTIAQLVEEMYIESIERESNVRFYKSINLNKSEINVYRTGRAWRDATVLTAHGASVVLQISSSQNVIDVASVKTDIVKGVIELALINYNTKISLKDIAAEKMLYETDGMDSLFDKFKHFLESNQVFSKLRFVSCQKDNVEVELFLCETGISNNRFQFVYLNKSMESNGKWKKFISALCEKQFENDLNAKFAVYLADIRVKNLLDNILVDNVIVEKCIGKCIEQMSQSSLKCKAAESTNVQKNKLRNGLEIWNEGHLGSEIRTNCNERKSLGVRLGDWIFNNSAANEMINQDINIYRNKVCENWVISLEKPKPKDTNDSLNFVEIENIQLNDDQFKKPLNKPIRKCKPYTAKYIPPVTPQVSPQLFKPSKYLEKFNDSSLMRASRKLITNCDNDLQTDVNMNNIAGAGTSFLSSHYNQNELKRSLFNNMHQRSSRSMPSKHMSIPTFFPTSNSIKKAAINSPIFTPENNRNVTDRLRIHRSVKETFETFDFQFRNNDKSNFNVSENGLLLPNTHLDPPQSRKHVNDIGRYEFSVHGTSKTHNHHRRSSSLSTYQQTKISSRVGKNRRSKSRSSSTTGVSRNNNNSTINDGIRQSGWPVTININFGQCK